jgi:hypothetical protein
MTNQEMTRREFLQATGLAAASLQVPAWLHESRDRVRLGIVGLGSSGFQHLVAYSAFHAVEISWLCDVENKALTRAVRHMASLRLARPMLTNDFRRLLDDPMIEAVSLAVPLTVQPLLARAAWKAGKSVLVDTPWAPSFQQALAAAQDVRGIKMTVGHRLADYLPEDVYLLDDIRVRSSIGPLCSATIHGDVFRGAARPPEESLAMLSALYFTLRMLSVDNGALGDSLQAQPAKTKITSPQWVTPITLPPSRDGSRTMVELRHWLGSPDANVMIEFIGENGRSGVKLFPTPRLHPHSRTFVEFLSALREQPKRHNDAMQLGYLASALMPG